MKRPTLLLFVTALVAGIGTVGFESRLVSAQRGEIQRLTRQIAATTGQVTALRRQRDGAAHVGRGH